MAKVNLIEKLQEIQNKEIKRRDSAIKCLKELIGVLAPILLEIEGDKVYDEETEAIWIPVWNKEEGKYTSRGTDIYFRYETHCGTNCSESEGFYISTDRLKLWGSNLFDIRGTEFWIQVKRITDWLLNYLPEYIENKDKSRDKRLEQLEKITKSLRKIK